MGLARRLLALLSAAGILAAVADGYPSRPIRMLVPWPPGQNTDLAARMVAEKLSTALGQPIVVENKAGAGGVIGTEAATKAAPDGYTLLAASSGPISIIPNVQKVPFDPQRDLAPISLLLTNPFVLVIDPSLPATNLKEFIALMKASPGKYSFSSSGSGATSHLMTLHFNALAGIDAVHVPYKGAAPSIMDVAGGQVAYTIESIAAVQPLLQSGRLRAIAVTGAKRSVALPGVPSIAETSGLEAYDIPAWVGVMAPAGTPRELRERLSREVRRIVESPELRERMVAAGMEPAASTPDEFTEFLRAQQARYAAIAKSANLKPD